MSVDQARQNPYQYLSRPEEIDARAREFATYLLLTGDSLDTIMSNLKNSSTKYLTNTTYNLYYKAFGTVVKNTEKALAQDPTAEIISPDYEQYRNIWHKFLRRTIDFLFLDHKFINKQSVLSAIDFHYQ